MLVICLWLLSCSASLSVAEIGSSESVDRRSRREERPPLRPKARKYADYSDDVVS